MSDPSMASRRAFLRRALLSAPLWTRPLKVLDSKLSTAPTDQDWLQQVSALRPDDQTAAEDSETESSTYTIQREDRI